MDETTVAEDLKKKIPEDAGFKNDPAQYPDPPTAESDHSNLPLENMLLTQEVADFLGLPRGFKNNPEMTHQLESILNWAKDLAGTHEVNDIVHILARKQSELGIRGKGDKLQRIYQYVKISSQIDSLYERQRSLYER